MRLIRPEMSYFTWSRLPMRIKQYFKFVSHSVNIRKESHKSSSRKDPFI